MELFATKKGAGKQHNEQTLVEGKPFKALNDDAALRILDAGFATLDDPAEVKKAEEAAKAEEAKEAPKPSSKTKEGNK